MDLTPELIESLGKASAGILVAIGGIIATMITAITGYFTWKTRYELDNLYAKTYRPEADGSPGKMRRHPKALVKLFARREPSRKSRREKAKEEEKAEEETAAKGSEEGQGE